MGPRLIVAAVAVVAIVAASLGYVWVNQNSVVNVDRSTPMKAKTVIDVPSRQSEGLVVGVKGGTVAYEGAAVTVPAGALARESSLRMTILDAPFHQQPGQPAQGSTYADAVGPAVDFGPEGTSFAAPVTVSVPYSPSLLRAGETAASIRPAFWDGTTWVLMDGTVDTASKTVSVRLSGFNGVVLEAVLGTVIAGTAVIIYNKLTATDAIVRGNASEWITPKDTVVEDAAKTATLDGVSLGDKKALAERLEKGGTAGIKMSVVDAGGTSRHIDWTDKGKGWKKPSEYLSSSKLVGDCTDSSNFETSILRALGYHAKAVFGYLGDVDHPHEWSEVLIHGKVYLVDEFGTFQPLAEAMSLIGLIRPEPGDTRYRSMWDEAGQAPYDPQWWRALVKVDPDQISSYSDPVHLKITVDRIPSFVKSFNTVIDWGDGSEPEKLKSDVPGDRKVVVTPDAHSFGKTPSDPIVVSFVNDDGIDLIEWGTFQIAGAADVTATVAPTSIEDPTTAPKLLIKVAGIPASIRTFNIAIDWGDGSAPQVVTGRKPDASGNYQTTIGKPSPFKDQGRGVTQVVVTFQDSGGRTLSKWPRIVVPVSQPTAAPAYTSVMIDLWMGHCQNCLDYRPGKAIRLVSAEPGKYAANPDDLKKFGLASLDLVVGDSGRTITSLRLTYASDPQDFFVLSNLTVTGTIKDPADQKMMSEYSLGTWSGIMPHLQWQANVTMADGSHKIFTQENWTEDPASAGQEYLHVFLKQP